MKVRIYGRDPLIDRIGVPAEIEEKLRPQLDLLDELVDYGVSVLKRTFSTGDRKLDDVVILLSLFRQVVVMLDSVAVHLRSGAVYAAHLPLRTLLEATWNLEWVFEHDRADEARRHLVGFLRRNARAARGFIPGTAEHTEAMAVTQDEFPDFVPGVGREDTFRSVSEAADRLLDQPGYKEINDAFEHLISKRNLPHEPNWFTPSINGEERPWSIRQLAKRLGRLAEYDYIYSSFASTSHGSSVAAHIRFGDERVVIEPIRSGEGFKMVLLLAASIGIRAFSMVLEEYRPGEMPVFRRTYVEEWRNRYMNMPEISIDEHLIDL